MVFYRKYRPQAISELDSKKLRETLFSFLSQSSIPQAFLFAGPKGLGKTSTARIVAKVINCETHSKLKTQNSKLADACNKCSQCISVTNGSNLDVLEIDAASNRGIDEIRDLREKVRLAPVSAKVKVYIIDEVHMLTTEAFNALLKTLEEPPAHTIFILCTTEFHKVPQTIVSRCFLIQFTKATTEELVQSFSRIAKAEKLEVEKDALLLIATLSEGSFRDGAKVLEEIALHAKDKKITKEFVEQKYKVINKTHYIEKLVDFLSNKDTKEALLLVAKMVEEGMDIKYFIEQFIGTLHTLLLQQVGLKKEEGEIPNHKLSLDEIKLLVRLLSQAYLELKYAVISELPLELAILEYVSNARGPVRSSFPASAPLASPSLRFGSDASARVGSPPASATPRGNSEIWEGFIDYAKRQNHSLAGVLRGCKLKSLDNNSLVLETSYKFHKEKLEDKKAQEILEKVVEEIVGKKIKVLIELKEKR